MTSKQEPLDANDSFEEAAAAFYKATGYLMPGKDGCERDADGELTPRVRDLFKAWCAALDYSRRAPHPDGLREALERMREDINSALDHIELGEEACATACLHRALSATPAPTPTHRHEWDTLHPAEDTTKTVGRRCETCGVCEWFPAPQAATGLSEEEKEAMTLAGTVQQLPYPGMGRREEALGILAALVRRLLGEKK